MAAFTQRFATQGGFFIYFFLFYPCLLLLLVVLQTAEQQPLYFPHGLNQADNRWVFLLILSRLKDHWITNNNLELDRGSKFKKQDTWQALYLECLRCRSLSHWQPEEYLAQLMGVTTQQTITAKPDRKGCRNSPIDIMSAPEKKKTQHFGSNINIFWLPLRKSKNPHDTPFMESDLSDSRRQTKLLWQEDKSSFNLWLSRQIISN